MLYPVERFDRYSTPQAPVGWHELDGSGVAQHRLLAEQSSAQQLHPQYPAPPRFSTVGAFVQDRTLQLWNPHKGLAIKAYRGHGYEVRDVSVATDNSQLASVGGDRQVFLWDVSSGAVIRKFRGHDSAINAVRSRL